MKPGFTPGYILACDTSTDQLVCALGKLSFDPAPHIEVVEIADTPARRRANTMLIPAVEDMLNSQGLTTDDLVAVVCGKGPGSFTGVRIGVATAKGLARACNIPLYAISTLDAVAYTRFLEGVRGNLCVLDDAMRKEVYPGLYTLTDEGVTRRFARETVSKVAVAQNMVKLHASKQPSDTPLILTGDALVKYADDLSLPGVQLMDADHLYPTGAGLLKAYEAQLCERVRQNASHQESNASQAVSEGDPALVLPVYTRLSDAEEHERLRLGLKEPLSTTLTGVSELLANKHLQLRPMSLNDCEQVAQLERNIFGNSIETWTKNMFVEEFSHADRVWWVAHDQGEIVAYAGAQLVDEDAQILDIAVDPKRRNQKIAQRLLSRVTYDSFLLGAKTASLEVSVNNVPAIELYKKLNFIEVGRRKNYYEAGVDALIMTAELPLTNIASFDEALPAISHQRYPHPQAQRTADEQACLEAVGPLVLAIETSCDETAVAVIDRSQNLVANIVATQIDFHARFGGVVPEIASRKHTEALVGVFDEALEQAGRNLGLASPLEPSEISAFAVTQGPGLVGALVVGLAFAKGVALGAHKPLIGVNHLEGHLYANLFETPDLKPPFVASLLSGGHTMLVHVKEWGTYEVLGETLDDAVGEAFDKVAKALGLGYPGGPIISQLAKQGDPCAIDFPRALLNSHDYRFSLSGLKTAVITYIQNENAAGRPIHIPDLAASFEQSVVDVQVAKALTACKEFGVTHFCVGGGVAANPRLRDELKTAFEKCHISVTLPPLSACTDNAAMIALVGLNHMKHEKFIDFAADSLPNMKLSGSEN